MSDGKGTISPPPTAGNVVLEYQRGGADSEPDQPLLTLGWAVYLGMSWTWCIGMFLPVLLIRDYGAWAWVVFAVPNVVGAAAMGWILREGQSQALVEHHRRAVDAFSFVTATFQIYFALWMFESHRMHMSPVMVLVIAALLWLGIRGQGASLVLAAAVLVMSLACVAAPDLWKSLELRPSDFSARDPLGLGALAPVCIFGFLLCPYLDDTFHRARQALSGPASAQAFSYGFGVFFFLMVVFTLLYARPLNYWLNGFLRGDFPRWIALHWTIQLAFTAALHWQRFRTAWGGAVATVAVAAILWFLGPFVSPRLGSGEFVYRLFMSFYGLIFPAYVWLCMLPRWHEPAAPTRAQWIVLALVIAVAAPFYWVAFMEGRMIWVVPGVLVVLMARFAVPKRWSLPKMFRVHGY